MSRVVIFGNSGSGKTSLAKRLAIETGNPHFDLDTVAWEAATPPVRASFEMSSKAIDTFIARHQAWIIEGCYTSLIEHAAMHASQLIYLNIGVEACVDNCRSRAWEPEKYPSKAAQDANLAMLIDWVRAYETRTDEFSRSAHRQLFESFCGPKLEVTSNAKAQGIQL